MTIEINGETYLSTVEACSAIGVSRETLNNYVNVGRIKRYKQGIKRMSFYKQSDVNNLVAQREEIREDTDE